MLIKVGYAIPKQYVHTCLYFDRLRNDNIELLMALQAIPNELFNPQDGTAIPIREFHALNARIIFSARITICPFNKRHDINYNFDQNLSWFVDGHEK